MLESGNHVHALVATKLQQHKDTQFALYMKIGQ